MNYVFISPHFPNTYYLFCKALKERGVNVLGITDIPTDYLPQEVKNNLTDHYKVDSLGNMDQKRNAMNYFIAKYGPVDYIESNNEFWLDDDAELRKEFKVTTGPLPEDIQVFNRKSLMKEYYKKAGVSTARWALTSNFDSAKAFVAKVGFPIVIKPDHGMGASNTYKLTNLDGLRHFFNEWDGAPYIMEEFIDGTLISFDGVCDSSSNVVYCSHHVFPTPIMEIVTGLKDVVYYTVRDIPLKLFDVGQSVLKSFKAKSRFFHLEFFKLNEDKEGLGKKDDYVGLEVNMRVPGGYTPDMINYAYSVDIYRIWADVMAFDKNLEPVDQKANYCLYVGRRDNVSYINSEENIWNRYHDVIMKDGRMPDALSEAMGNRYFIFRIPDYNTLIEIWRYALKRK